MAKAKKSKETKSKQNKQKENRSKGKFQPKKDTTVQAKKPPRKERKFSKDSENIRGIVRLGNKDLDGYLNLNRAILAIKGISHSLKRPISNLVCEKLNIKKDTKIGELKEEQLEQINDIIHKLDDKILPSFMLNRRKDQATGKNIHVVVNDLLFTLRQDIEAKKKSRTWQGSRHVRGVKVRGQRTKNTGRRGSTMGVVKKKQMPGAAPGTAAKPPPAK